MQFYNFSKLFPSASNLIHIRQLLQSDRKPGQLEVRVWFRDEGGGGSGDIDGGQIKGVLSQYGDGDGELDARHAARPGQTWAGGQRAPSSLGLLSRAAGEYVGERTRENTGGQPPLYTLQSTSIGTLMTKL